MKVLVTGANGFVGQALVSCLRQRGLEVVAASRHGAGAGETAVGDIGPNTVWRPLLSGCQAVVHAAARVHQMNEGPMDGLQQARRVNTGGSLALARQAAQAGVRRFIFISSVKVNGEAGAFDASQPCRPADAYGISKLEAESGLAQIAAQSGMELIVLRLPLVYGPGVRANFLRLMKAVDRGMPLPFGKVNNRRSLLYLGNLADAIHACLMGPPSTAARTWYVSDDEDVSTAALARGIALALGVPARLIPVPPALLRLAAAMLGKADAAKRLLGSLTVDCHTLRRELGWQPPFSVQEGLQATADWYRTQRKEQAA